MPVSSCGSRTAANARRCRVANAVPLWERIHSRCGSTADEDLSDVLAPRE